MYRKFFKRALDLFLSIVGLLVLWPLMLLIALIVRRDSKGGALFRQTRLGKNQKPFVVYKFRTMVPGAYQMGGSVTYEGDPRITKVGAFLRKTSLDELPQLWNILKGDMSVIGPRPILAEELAPYAGNPNAQRRYAERPGLFCSVDTDYRAMASRTLQFDMDAAYCDSVTFHGDVLLFFRVLRTVLAQKNVYRSAPEADPAASHAEATVEPMPLK